MTDASFKDVPELFEVRYCTSGVVLGFTPLFFPGRNRGSIDCAHRESRYVFPSGFRERSQQPAATFRELGPPDLCHVVKSTGRAGQRDVSTLFPRARRRLTPTQLGSFHFISGVDASSSASLAAYINSLTYAIEDNSAWFSKGPVWKVRNGCYCCFNAFSRVDVRVDVKIPGGVHAYVVDLRGERCVTLVAFSRLGPS